MAGNLLRKPLYGTESVRVSKLEAQEAYKIVDEAVQDALLRFAGVAYVRWLPEGDEVAPGIFAPSSEASLALQIPQGKNEFLGLHVAQNNDIELPQLAIDIEHYNRETGRSADVCSYNNYREDDPPCLRRNDYDVGDGLPLYGPDATYRGVRDAFELLTFSDIDPALRGQPIDVEEAVSLRAILLDPETTQGLETGGFWLPE
jgi:hypothetical protein